MRPFDLYSPTSLPEALSLLTELDGQGLPLAGGTDLLPSLRTGELAPSAVVSLRRLEELRRLSFDPARGLSLGAGITLRRLTRDPLIHRHYPILAETAGLMASEQVRSLATVGGNLCNASPSADLAPPLLVLGAEVLLVGPQGERRIPLEVFFLGPGASARQATELLVEIRLPPPRGKAAYLKHAPRAYMDLAVAGAAVRVAQPNGGAGEVAIALGAVAPVPMLALQAQQAIAAAGLSPQGIRRAASAAAEECSPIDDVRASAGYRRHLIEVLVRRGLESLLDGGGAA